ncbi:MAG: thioether cross-link-forming SCIFF peptide maturase [Clostridiales bacterium]|nr:thioether cross-link-forming SCIFF peptide maturase [Clostridiales bacterium]
MVHLFEMTGKKIAYDSECSSIYSLDDLSYDVLNMYNDSHGQKPPVFDLDRLVEKSGYDRAEVEEICDSFDELIRQEALFAPTVFADYTRLYPDGPIIKAMCLHICHDCNMRCKYCFAGTGDYGTHKRSMLSLETGKKAVDFLIAASGNRHHLDIDFFGGEPLMNWPVVVDLAHYCEEAGKKSGKDIRITITTNALLLDQEKSDFINWHMKNCVLSIDGRPEVHNHMRPGIGGRPTYEPISRNIRRFVKLRENEDSLFHEYYVRGTYTRNNLDFTEDVKHLAEALHAQHLSMEPVVSAPNTGYDIRGEDVEAIEKEYERLAQYLHGTRKTERPIHFFHFRMDFEGGPCVYKRLKGCGVGSEYIAVTPEGDIYPCHQFVGEERFLMGNVTDMDKIVDAEGQILKGKSTDDLLDKDVRQIFFDRLMPNRQECKECFARYHCGGGCAANRYYATGSLDEEYEIGCKLVRKRLECSLWLACVKQENEM